MEKEQKQVARVRAKKQSDQEKIKELQEQNAILTNIVTSLKRQIGGYKTSNTNLRKDVSQLTTDREKANDYTVQLQEKYKACVCERNKFAANLANAEHKVHELEARVKELETKWWRKLFRV